jgi:hypothetical protein
VKGKVIKSGLRCSIEGLAEVWINEQAGRTGDINNVAVESEVGFKV